MTLETLDNLVKINKLKNEPPDQNEFDGMRSSAELLKSVDAMGPVK